MESWMRVGAKVVCVNAGPVNGWPAHFELCENAIYTIRAVFTDPHWPAANPIFRLEEVTRETRQWALGYFEAGFSHIRFRPVVRRTDISSLRALLDAPADPVLVGEEMDALTSDVLRLCWGG